MEPCDILEGADGQWPVADINQKDPQGERASMSSADGTWKTTMNTPMGNQEGTLTLKTDGNRLTGKLAGPQGEIDVADGQVDGDRLTWKANLTSPMPMTLEFDATVEGDEISGNVKLGAFGNATFSGTRA